MLRFSVTPEVNAASTMLIVHHVALMALMPCACRVESGSRGATNWTSR